MTERVVAFYHHSTAPKPARHWLPVGTLPGTPVEDSPAPAVALSARELPPPRSADLFPSESPGSSRLPGASVCFSWVLFRPREINPRYEWFAKPRHLRGVSVVLDGLVLESRNRALEAPPGPPGPTFLGTFVVLQAEVRGIRYLLAFNPCMALVLTLGTRAHT